MYSAGLYSSYPSTGPRTHEECPKKFSWRISKKVYLPVSKFSNRMITSGLNNGRLNTSDVNMSTPPKYCGNFYYSFTH